MTDISFSLEAVDIIGMAPGGGPPGPPGLPPAAAAAPATAAAKPFAPNGNWNG
jgi:hypothetical protein